MDNTEVQYAVKDITERLKKRYKPQMLVLFGSCANGRVRDDSDIDMLVVKDTKSPPRQRWMQVCKIARNLKRRIPFEPIIITPKELEKRRQLNDPFLKEIFQTGKVIYNEN